MSEIQVTVNSGTLKKVIVAIVIIALLGLNIYQWVSHSKGNTVTGAVTGTAGTPAATAPSTSTPSTTTATCTDNIKNQDETAVDCGGVCGGYFYDGKCNADQKPECQRDLDCKEGYVCKSGSCTSDPDYCRMNSDCKTGYECKGSKCMEIPPECTADKDCTSSQQCTAGKCVDKPLSGRLSVNIGAVDTGAGVGNNTRKVKSVKLEITNGLHKSITIYGKAFVYTKSTDPMYNIGKQFDIGTFASGETSNIYYDVPNEPSFENDLVPRTIKIQIFDDTDTQLTPEGTLTKKFYP